MIVRSFAPLDGEHIAAVSPPVERDVEGVWQRRLRLFNGRSLTAAAFTLEQVGRASLESTANQLVSWGVVDGLQASFSTEGTAPNQRFFIEIASGLGIAAGGEEVILPAPVRVELKNIPGLDVAGDKFGILVLEPVEAKLLGNVLPTDQCEFDETTDAFSDWQLIDGCRLRFIPWPAGELRIPVPSGTTARNRAAYAIYDVERSFTPDQTFSWDETGVPVALISVAASGAPLFVDRYSVVRDGGRPRHRSSPLPDSGYPTLWQARLQQFSEQLAQTDFDPKGAANGSQFFALLPPVGLLPKQWFTITFDPLTGLDLRHNFFPLQFRFVASPIPLEQLDAAIEASASFLPIDTSTRQRVELLIPVPQVVYEPGLLVAERVDRRFNDAIDSASTRRGDALGRRILVRQTLRNATEKLTGKAPEFPATDPNQIDRNEAVNPNPPADIKDNPVDVDGILTNHQAQMEKILGGIYKDAAAAKDKANQLAALGLAPAAERLEILADRADDVLNVGFLRIQTDQYRLRNILLGSSATSRLAVSPALAGIAEVRTAVAQEAAINAVLDEMKKNSGTDITKRQFQRVRIPTNADFDFSGRLTNTNILSAPVNTLSSRTFGVQDVALRLETPATTRLAPTTRFASEIGGDFAAPAAAPVSFGAGAPVSFAAAPLAGFAIGTSAISFSAAAATTMVSGLTFQAKLATDVLKKPLEIPRIDYSTPVEVITQPVQGRQEIRITTTEQRIQPAKGPQARDFALSTKYSIVNSLKNTPAALLADPNDPTSQIIKLSDVFANAIIPSVGVWMTVNQSFTWVFEKDAAGVERNLQRQNKLLSSLEQVAINRILEEPDDKGVTDESHYFYAAVDIIESAVGALRGAESFVETLRQAAAQCRKTAELVANAVARLQERLGEIEDMIAEGRQDVAVAKALLAEEQQRVALINARRARVLAEQVQFLCFRRPPTVTSIAQVPTRIVDPEVLTPSVPVCISRNLTPPPELQKLVDIIREAPVLWFPNIEKLLERLDRRESLRDALVHASGRVTGKVSAVLDNPLFLQTTSGRFATPLLSILSAQRDVSIEYRRRLPLLDPAFVFSLSWRQSYQEVRKVLTIGDLIDGVGGRSDLSRLAGQELDKIARVSACLHEKFTEALPDIRLDWALRFSQYDQSVDFSNLAYLPRWGEIDYLDRHDMQTFVDWLFAQIDRKDVNAVATINNIIRTAILLASHAPVNRLIQGAIDQAADVREGESATVSFDTTVMDYVRRGQEMHLVRQGVVIAKAVVDDLLDKRVQINITQNLTSQPVLKLDTSIKVQSVLNSEQNRVVRTLVQGDVSRTTALIQAVSRK